MNLKYRTFEPCKNSILNVKLSTHGTYKGLKTTTTNASSKKIQPLSIKIFDRSRRNPRILSRNDRVDLFLEGGNFSETRKHEEKFSNDRTFYKMSRMKKKSDIIKSLRCEVKTNGWHGHNFVINSDANSDSHFLHSSDGCRSNLYNEQIRIARRIQPQQKTSGDDLIRKNSSDRKPIRNLSRQKQRSHESTATNHRTQEIKTQLRTFVERTKLVASTSCSQNQIAKKEKERPARPMFYVEPKQIGHINADSFIVTEYPTGSIVFGSYFKKAGEIASLTKIMTFYAVYDIASRYGRDLAREIIEIDEQAQSASGTSAEIFVGDIYTAEQLLYGLMLPSGNDAAIALAKWAGTILQKQEPAHKSDSGQTEVKAFVRHMNICTKKCNMKASKFCNPHGLPHPQSSSNAEDLANLISECLKIELFRKVIKTKKYSCWVEHNGVKHEVIWENTNKLLRRPNFIGGKTGVTVTAGPCLASCYQLNDKIYIVILLRTNKLSRRFKQTRYILALALSKLDKSKNSDRIKQLLRNDAELDSDNSDDQEEFNYDKNDAREMAKRNKILTFEM